MKTWRLSSGFDRCASCGKGLGPTPPTRRVGVKREPVPVLDVRPAGTDAKRVFCVDCAKRIFTEYGRHEQTGEVFVLREEVPPDVLVDAKSALRPPAPSLPLDGIHQASHQGFVTAGELARREQARRRRIDAAKARQESRTAVAEPELPDAVLESPLYRPPGVRHYLDELEARADREPGEDDDL